MASMRERGRRFDLWRCSGAPALHADKRAPLDTEPFASVWPGIVAAAQVGGIVGLIGAPGTGKTQLAVELIRVFCRDLGRSGV
ncbi:ATP-binding protein, partial [Klebsiella pneumoniae]|nr:ATP-binding protein [Klebsiella pneumoniae]